MTLALHLAVLFGLPILMIGVINRTKALWAGRKGPPLLQPLYDLTRLLSKAPVYSRVTTPLFWLAPLVVLSSAIVSGLAVPLLGSHSPISFPYDFVVVAYLWGLGRIFMVLAALDAGSSFEGMGASREVTYAAFVEPALFLCLGTLAAASGHASFSNILSIGVGSADRVVTTVASMIVLFIVLQVESSRVPADDPSTHLELTMVHEVMILDHSGPDLAALQYASAMKLTLLASLIAGLLNPLPEGARGGASAIAHLVLTLSVAVVVGFVESLIARFKLKALPQYIVVAAALSGVALLTTAWRIGGSP